MFGSSPPDALAGAAYIALLTAAGAFDLRQRRIPNSLVALLALAGLGYAVAELGTSAGVISAIAGSMLGLAIWLPCYALRMLGAGDVKFFAAGAAWLGPRLALSAAALSALLGGVLAICWVLWWRARPAAVSGGVVHGNPGEGALAPARTDQSFGRALPYGVAMAAGLGVIAWFPQLLR